MALQAFLDPATYKQNRAIQQANIQTYTKALGDINAYKNKGTAFKSGEWDSAINRSMADSNLWDAQNQAISQANLSFEKAAKLGAQLAGPSGEGSRSAEAGRTNEFLALLENKRDIEMGLRDAFGGKMYGQYRANARRQVNEKISNRNKLGIAPTSRTLRRMKKTNPLTAAFTIGKTALSIYGGVSSFAAGMEGKEGWGAFKGGLDKLSGWKKG
jgi:hypothetical protein